MVSMHKGVPMNKLRVGHALTLGVLSFCLCGAAAADHGHDGGHWHSHIGVGIAVDPFWFGAYPYGGYAYPPYYYPLYYYPPPVMTVPAAPSVYIERDESPAPEEAYWYYCAKPKGYYPHVKECPGGWRRVSPQPPPDEER